MKDWTEHKIGEIGEFVGGGTPSTEDPACWDGEIPWLVPSDISNHQENYLWATSKTITEKGLRTSSAKLLPQETVCMSSRATIGDCVIAKIPLTTNQGFINIICNEKVYNEFLLYWIRQNKNYILKYVAGTTFGEIGKSTFKKLKINLPEKHEQRTIANVLSKVDEAITATQNSIAKAQRLKKALMQNLISGKLKPDGTWRNEDEFYKDDKFGNVPIGWKYDKLESVLSNCQYGINSTSVADGKIPMFRMNNIKNGMMVEQPMVYINLDEKLFEKYKVKKGDILFNRTNSMDLVGKLGIFKLEGNYVFASYLIRLTVDENNIPDYFNLYLNTYEGQCKLRSKATPSVSQANINAGNVKKLIVPIPPKDEQFQISNKIESIVNILISKQVKIKKLERLKKALMQNLLTGKVRVTVQVEHLSTTR